jgi:glycosyltransferase involved in cell wall biosynthesis
MLTTSVIVSTYNGADKISNLLEALLKQTYSNFELIVVIDGSTDNTKQVLEKYFSVFETLRIVEQKNRGRSAVRNRGASEASGDLLVFYDDDMVPFSGSVERHVHLHSDNMEKLVSGNPVEFTEPGKTDVQNYKATRTVKWTEKYTEPVTSLNLDNLFFTAANCSVRRSVLAKLNGFEERLTDAEDYNLAQRALMEGIPVFFDRDNTAVHLDFITAHSYVLRQRHYRKADERIRSLFPALPGSRIRSQHSIKRLMYRLFARSLCVKWIESGRLMFIPQTIRYRLYDVIIHALATEYPDVKI